MTWEDQATCLAMKSVVALINQTAGRNGTPDFMLGDLDGKERVCTCVGCTGGEVRH